MTLLTRFVAGVSAITSLNSSMTDVTSIMEAGVGTSVEALAVVRSLPEMVFELWGCFPFFSDRGCSDPGDALRLLDLYMIA